MSCIAPPSCIRHPPSRPAPQLPLRLPQGVSKFVLVTSIGCDDPLFPLNLFWGVLFWKKQGEVALQRSGLDYTVVRPGGWAGLGRAGLGWDVAGWCAFGRGSQAQGCCCWVKGLLFIVLCVASN